MRQPEEFRQQIVNELKKIRFPGSDPSETELAELEEESPATMGELSPQLFAELATARNKQLITKEQQSRLQETVVGFFGLSVGSHAALTWMMQSRANAVKISDPDTVDWTNLNRLRFGVQTVGQPKVAIVRAELEAINPYTKVHSTRKTDEDTVKGLFSTAPALNLVVDAIDDLPSKLLLRQLAREHQIPLLSAVDVGDNIFLDVERYDQDTDLVPFLGRVPEIETLDLNSLDTRRRTQLLIQLVGLEHNSEAMLYSLTQIGTSIPTWPQLGATATMAGGLICTTIKKIVLGEEIPSGRVILSMDELLDRSYGAPSRVTAREKTMSEIKSALQIT